MPTITYSSREVASGLRKLGLKVLFHNPSDELYDGHVQLHDRVHVQVGAGFMVVVELDKDNAHRYYTGRTTIPAVYKDAVKAIRKAEKLAGKSRR